MKKMRRVKDGRALSPPCAYSEAIEWIADIDASEILDAYATADEEDDTPDLEDRIRDALERLGERLHREVSAAIERQLRDEWEVEEAEDVMANNKHTIRDHDPEAARSTVFKRDDER